MPTATPPPKAEQRGSARTSAQRGRHRAPQPSFDLTLKTLGLKRSARNCIEAFLATHSSHWDWTYEDLAAMRDCHPSQISRAKPILLAQGLAVLKEQGHHGDQPKASTFQFTEKAYLLASAHRAKRTSPEVPSSPKTSPATGQSRTAKQGARPGLPEAWQSCLQELRAVALGIPSPRPLNERAFPALLAQCALEPVQALRALRLAGAQAVTLPHVQDPRAWSLRVLTSPSFAASLLAQEAEEPVRPSAPEPEASPLQQGLVEAGVQPAGLKVAVEGVQRAKVPQDLLPYLLQAAQETVARRQRHGTVPKPLGLLVHLLRTTDQDLLTQAKARKARAMALGLPETGQVPSHPSAGLPPALQAFPGARNAFSAWFAHQAVLDGLSLEAPGWLEAFDAAKAARVEALLVAKRFLGETRVRDLEDDLRRKLCSAGLWPDTPLWRQAWSHHLGKAVWAAIGFQ